MELCPQVAQHCGISSGETFCSLGFELVILEIIMFNFGFVSTQPCKVDLLLPRRLQMSTGTRLEVISGYLNQHPLCCLPLILKLFWTSCHLCMHIALHICLLVRICFYWALSTLCQNLQGNFHRAISPPTLAKSLSTCLCRLHYSIPGVDIERCSWFATLKASRYPHPLHSCFPSHRVSRWWVLTQVHNGSHKHLLAPSPCPVNLGPHLCELSGVKGLYDRDRDAACARVMGFAAKGAQEEGFLFCKEVPGVWVLCPLSCTHFMWL